MTVECTVCCMFALQAVLLLERLFEKIQIRFIIWVSNLCKFIHDKDISNKISI